MELNQFQARRKLAIQRLAAQMRVLHNAIQNNLDRITDNEELIDDGFSAAGMKSFFSAVQLDITSSLMVFMSKCRKIDEDEQKAGPSHVKPEAKASVQLLAGLLNEMSDAELAGFLVEINKPGRL